MGNKSDLEEYREVNPEEGASFAQENGYKFLETSCLKNKNVASAFETLIEITNIEAQKGNGQKKTKLKKENKKEEKGCFC